MLAFFFRVSTKAVPAWFCSSGNVIQEANIITMAPDPGELDSEFFYHSHYANEEVYLQDVNPESRIGAGKTRRILE